MAKIKERMIQFSASDSPDVVNNRLYYKEGVAPDYDSPCVDVGNETDASGFVVVNLAEHLGDLDGDYFLGVTAVDDVGNEATMVKTAGAVPLDFVAPDPVGDIVLL